MSLYEDVHDREILVHHGDMKRVVSFISDAEHDLGHLVHHEPCEISAAVATGGVEETGPVEGDGDVFVDPAEDSHHVSVVDDDAVAVGRVCV